MRVWRWWWNPANTAWVTSRLWRPCVRARLNWCSSPATPLLWGENGFGSSDGDKKNLQWKILQRSRFPLRPSMFELLLEPYGVLLKADWEIWFQSNTCVDGNYGVVFCVTTCNIGAVARCIQKIKLHFGLLRSAQFSSAQLSSSWFQHMWILGVRNSALKSNDY